MLFFLGETQDSQEFSPSCFERSFVPSPNCFTSRYDTDRSKLPKFQLSFSKSELYVKNIYISILFLQSFLRTQQRGMPDHGVRPWDERLFSQPHAEKEKPEETKKQGEEKAGEEGDAAAETPNAVWSPWTGEWEFCQPDPGENWCFFTSRKFT